MNSIRDFKVMVVGAGTMGSGIAQVFAAKGIKTVMTDVKQEFLDNAKKSIAKNIEGMIEEKLADSSYQKNIEENISTILADEIPNVAGEMDLVVEVIFEDKDAKRDLYRTLSDYCKKECILASNTSGMDIFAVTEDVLKNPERLIITHWFNPPHLMKIVEVVKGPKTSDEVVCTVRELLEYCGKKPSLLNKFMAGFIVNRMATVVCRELYYMVEQGWISPHDAENALKYTDGLRWSFEGPLELWDFVGLEIPIAVAKDVLPTLCNDTEGIPYGDKLIREGKTGVKAGEGMLGKYPSDIDGYIRKRNKRIIQMYKVMERFEKEDSD